MPRVPWIVGVTLAAATACTSHGKVGQQPSWRRPTEVAASSTGAPGRTRIVRLDPEGEGVDAYNDPPRTPAPHFPLADDVLAAVEEASAALGKPAPVADGRLFAAARDLAEVAPEDAPLAYGLVEFAMQRHGIIEPSPHLVVNWGAVDDPSSILEQLEPRLPDILASVDFARIGIGTARRGQGAEVTVLAFQASSIDTDPIPRSLPASGRARIEGTIHAPYRDPQIFVTREDGSVEQPPMARIGASGFTTDLECDGRRGRHQIEITAVDSTGSTVLANFPLWCGEEPPTSIAIDTSEDDGAPIGSSEEAQARMVDLVNRDRAAHGLPPLEVDPRLTEVARAHSAEMLETGVVAHVSPRTGTAADRVKAGNIASSVVLENVARAYGIGEAEEGLMNSPGHRANILAGEATHIGIGIQLGEEVAGRHELFITQLFIRVPRPIDPDSVRADVVEIIRRARKLREDPVLGVVAHEFARELARGASTSQASARASRRLDKVAPSFSRVTTLVTTVADVSAFDPRASLEDPRLTHFGLGIAQGDHPVMGEDSIYVVVLLGQK